MNRMKLPYRITLRLSFILIPLLAIWSIFFFVRIVSEINDETDDALDRYAELIIRRSLAGFEIPDNSDDTNRTFFIRPISSAYALSQKSVAYKDTVINFVERDDKEPARLLRVIYQNKNDQFYELKVMMPTFEKLDLITTISNQMILLYLCLIITVIIVTAFMLRRSMKPLSKLLRWLDFYNPGNKSLKVPTGDKVPEFEKLSKALQGAINRTEEIYDKQKIFIGNASHELQTPLAVINNRIDWMIDQMDLNEKQLKELFQMKRDVQHLIKMNKTLLLLTKIENQQFPQTTLVNIVSLINELCETYQEIYAYKNITCELNLPIELTLRINDTLANILISHLVRNAFVHTPDNVTIIILLNNKKFDISH